MNQTQRSHPRRGFTLVELLVVIAIIAILMGLLVPAVMYMLSKGPKAVATSEIGQLDQAIQTFKTAYHVDYIPSRIMLCERFSDYDGSQLSQDSIAYLKRVWPHITDPGSPWLDSTKGIDWNGNGAVDAGQVILEGDQCLVFFLGGIPIPGATPGITGFSNDPRDPSRGTARKNPSYEFPTSRLFLRTSTPGGAKGFYSFADPYGKNMPYAYFSSYGVRNGYGKYAITYSNGPPPIFQVQDCNSLGVYPYYSVAGATKDAYQFYNPTGHQIICAGADGQFGLGGMGPSGTAWTPANAGSIPQAGKDDLSNFNSGNLMSVGG